MPDLTVPEPAGQHIVNRGKPERHGRTGSVPAALTFKARDMPLEGAHDIGPLGTVLRSAVRGICHGQSEIRHRTVISNVVISSALVSLVLWFHS